MAAPPPGPASARHPSRYCRQPGVLLVLLVLQLVLLVLLVLLVMQLVLLVLKLLDEVQAVQHCFSVYSACRARSQLLLQALGNNQHWTDRPFRR